MASDEEVLQHYSMSLEFLGASKESLREEYIEPALFCSIHALELAVKLVLLTEIDDPIYTHNVGGKLGKYFREEYGEDICREVNSILRMYNLPRYPGPESIDREEAVDIMEFVADFIEIKIKGTLQRKGLLMSN